MLIIVSSATQVQPPRRNRLRSSSTETVHCRDHRFQLRRLRAINSGKQFDAYQCSACGVVVPACNIELTKRLDRMQYELSQISKKLGE